MSDTPAVNKFTRLKIENWRQFLSVDLELHPKLTVLTGANGAGKTTLINVLTQHFGWAKPLLSTPWIGPDGRLRLISGTFQAFLSFLRRNEPSRAIVGAISYSNGVTTPISVPIEERQEYNMSFDQQQHVPGISIPSHRVQSKYQPVSTIPSSGISAQQAYGNYAGEINNRVMGNHSGMSPLFRMKEALISMAMFGEGNTYIRGQPALLAVFTEFVEILKRVLPESLGFTGIEIQPTDVMLKTKAGTFLIDSVSGGIGSVIDLAWQLHVFSKNSSSFTAIIDEPENHLHPSMQRTLLPRFLDAFPNVQFIAATHSPFIVTAVKDSIVHVLTYKEDDVPSDSRAFAPERSVTSQKLDQVNKAGSANEILRDVLGVESTIPMWAADQLGAVIERYRRVGLTAESVTELRDELVRLGAGYALPKAIDSIVSSAK